MERLPLELHHQIVEILASDDNPHLAQYASISRTWQAAIEQKTFRDLCVSSSEFPLFHTLYDGGNIRRRRMLLWLRVSFLLPARNNACCDVQRFPGGTADTVSFSASVARLFAILKDLRLRVGASHPLNLRVSTATRERDEEFGMWSWTRCPNRHGRRDAYRSMMRNGFYRLVAPKEPLPELDDVCNFVVTWNGVLPYLWPSWPPVLLNRMPNLEALDVEVWDELQWGRRYRREFRKGTLCFLYPS